MNVAKIVNWATSVNNNIVTKNMLWLGIKACSICHQSVEFWHPNYNRVGIVSLTCLWICLSQYLFLFINNNEIILTIPTVYCVLLWVWKLVSRPIKLQTLQPILQLYVIDAQFFQIFLFCSPNRCTLYHCLA